VNDLCPLSAPPDALSRRAGRPIAALYLAAVTCIHLHRVAGQARSPLAWPLGHWAPSACASATLPLCPPRKLPSYSISTTLHSKHRLIVSRYVGWVEGAWPDSAALNGRLGHVYTAINFQRLYAAWQTACYLDSKQSVPPRRLHIDDAVHMADLLEPFSSRVTGYLPRLYWSDAGFGPIAWLMCPLIPLRVGQGGWFPSVMRITTTHSVSITPASVELSFYHSCPCFTPGARFSCEYYSIFHPSDMAAHAPPYFKS
jgi:hypothetical protein